MDTPQEFPEFDQKSFTITDKKLLKPIASAYRLEVLQEQQTFIPEEVQDDRQFLKNYEELDLKKIGQTTVDQSNVPLQYIKLINKQNEPYFVRKSSILWMLETDKKRVCSDRLLRFVDSTKTNSAKDSKLLFCGNYAAFVFNDDLIVGLVLGFKYQKGKNTNYTLDSCPLNPPTDIEKQKGIDVLCDFFVIGIKFELIPKRQTSYIDISNFRCHLDIVFNEDNNLQISEFSSNEFKKYL